MRYGSFPRPDNVSINRERGDRLHLVVKEAVNTDPRESSAVPDVKPWTANDVPDLSGRTFIITGGNSGIGYEAASGLAARHANVVIACRSLDRARTAASAIANAHPGAAVEVMEVDLASLASVRAFADAFHKQHQRLDVLCNNAGVMALPYRRTADGFEMQFGTNHLGHFALTGLLMDLLMGTPNSRVVTVSLAAHITWVGYALTICRGSIGIESGCLMARAS